MISQGSGSEYRLTEDPASSNDPSQSIILHISTGFNLTTASYLFVINHFPLCLSSSPV